MLVLAYRELRSLQVAYVPQPKTDYAIGSGGSGLFSGTEHAAVCSPRVTSGCEIDSGRFPVELKANHQARCGYPQRRAWILVQPVGQTSAQLTITLLNDSTVANPPTVNFVGKVVVKGNYSETDDCPV